jgi:hypothetical protein
MGRGKAVNETPEEREARIEAGYHRTRKKAYRGEVSTYSGEVGNQGHITRDEWGYIPIEQVRNMPGGMGEIPGESRRFSSERDPTGSRRAAFDTDIAEHGVKNPIFIVKEHGKAPQLYEGNHRRDAAVRLGHTHIPVNVRYFGHSEREVGGSLFHDRRLT